jgi:chromosome segregation ATPase
LVAKSNVCCLQALTPTKRTSAIASPDLDALRADIEETNKQWQQANSMFDSDMAQIQRLVQVSEQRDNMYASYREQLLELAEEVEKQEAEARAKKLARKRAIARQQAEELRMARLRLETDIMGGLEAMIEQSKVVPKIKVSGAWQLG